MLKKQWSPSWPSYSLKNSNHCLSRADFLKMWFSIGTNGKHIKSADPFRERIREMQIKPQRDTTSHPLGWLLFKKKKSQKISLVKDMEKLEPWCTAGGNVKWYSCCGKQFGSFIKHTNCMIQQLQSWVSILREIKTYSGWESHSPRISRPASCGCDFTSVIVFCRTCNLSPEN